MSNYMSLDQDFSKNTRRSKFLSYVIIYKKLLLKIYLHLCEEHILKTITSPVSFPF